MRHVERLFWLICLAAIALGLFLPAVGALNVAWLKPKVFGQEIALSRYFLMGILFFTYLKIDWGDVVHHLRQPLMLAYMVAMILFVLPVAIWAVARVVMPAYLIGIVILASMPAGMAGSSLTHVAGGNAALALLGTTLTTFLAPITVPLMVRWLGGAHMGGNQSVTAVLLHQTEWLVFILFTPAVLAILVRRLSPRFVERNRDRFTGWSIISLGILIFAIVAGCSRQALDLAFKHPLECLALFGFVAFFSVSRHLSAFGWAFWRPWRDKVGLSINSAYVNNGLSMTFAATFFVDAAGNPLPEAVLPSVLIEITMILSIVGLQRWAKSIIAREAAAAR